MKTFVAVLALVAVAAADVSHLHVRTDETSALVEKQESEVLPDRYKYDYRTSNGISGSEQGQLKHIDQQTAAISVEGANSYTSPEGQVVQLTYVADENGYRPVGAHLPTPPAPQEIPDYILRSIEYNRIHSENGERKI